MKHSLQNQQKIFKGCSLCTTYVVISLAGLNFQSHSVVLPVAIRLKYGSIVLKLASTNLYKIEDTILSICCGFLSICCGICCGILSICCGVLLWVSLWLFVDVLWGFVVGIFVAFCRYVVGVCCGYCWSIVSILVGSVAGFIVTPHIYHNTSY